MTNNLFKVTNSAGTHFITCPTISAAQFKELIEIPGNQVSTFEAGKVELTELPEKVQQKVRDTLKAFNEVTVTYERAQFTVSASTFISAHYPSDHFVCGTYYQKKVYTPEERKANFLEEFGYLPRIPNYFN